MSKLERYYEILGVSPNSSIEEIRRAYRKLAHDYHPDHQSGATDAVIRLAEQKFIEVQEAYEVLTDRAKRKLDNRSRVRSDEPPRAETATASKVEHEPKRPRTSPPDSPEPQASPFQPTTQQGKRSELIRLHIATVLLAIAAIPAIAWMLLNLSAKLVFNGPTDFLYVPGPVAVAFFFGPILVCPLLLRLAHTRWDLWRLSPATKDTTDDVNWWKNWAIGPANEASFIEIVTGPNWWIYLLIVTAPPGFVAATVTLDYIETDPLSFWAWFSVIIAYPSSSISLIWLLIMYPISISAIRRRYR